MNKPFLTYTMCRESCVVIVKKFNADEDKRKYPSPKISVRMDVVVQVQGWRESYWTDFVQIFKTCTLGYNRCTKRGFEEIVKINSRFDPKSKYFP